MGKELNAEAVLASIVELRASIAEQGAELRASIAEQGAELRASIAELRASIAEQGAELRASIAKQGAELRANIDELRKKMEITDSKLDNNTHVMGLLTNKLGGIIESIVIPGIVEKFNEKGFDFNTIRTNVEFLNEKKNANLAEVDALLENGSFVIAVETKTDMQVRDINQHIKRLKVLRKIPRFKGKKIYGAFSTAIARKRPINYALEQGIYVLQQPDVMGVKILDFPKGRSAKAW
jgi:DNA repair exonuclease SbcCD ATPase subunit